MGFKKPQGQSRIVAVAEGGIRSFGSSFSGWFEFAWLDKDFARVLQVASRVPDVL